MMAIRDRSMVFGFILLGYLLRLHLEPLKSENRHICPFFSCKLWFGFLLFSKLSVGYMSESSYPFFLSFFPHHSHNSPLIQDPATTVEPKICREHANGRVPLHGSVFLNAAGNLPQYLAQILEQSYVGNMKRQQERFRVFDPNFSSSYIIYNMMFRNIINLNKINYSRSKNILNCEFFIPITQF